MLRAARYNDQLKLLYLLFRCSTLNFLTAFFNVLPHPLEGIASSQSSGKHQHSHRSNKFFHDFPFLVERMKVPVKAKVSSSCHSSASTPLLHFDPFGNQ